ncbi:hypothetical protein HG430_003475 [Candidatus Gracilibacteria bacterium]|nr:hypothetical protein [Candidatus Gracilibacteria bacterium]
MKKNKKAFSLIIVMGLVLLSVLLGMNIINYIIPFSRDIVGFENAARSYYLANSGLEAGIYKLGEQENNLTPISTDYLSKNFKNIQKSEADKLSNAVTIITENLGTVEPKPGNGDSEFDRDYNTISFGQPIQINVSKIDNLSDLSISFKVPKTDFSSNFELVGEDTKPYLSWQLSSEKGFVNSGEDGAIKKGQINNKEINIGAGLIGEALTNSGKIKLNISTAKTQYCGAVETCILKISLINDLKIKLDVSGQEKEVNIPFLEWKLVGKKNFRFRYADLVSQGKATGYIRILEAKIPQTTVNEAFDFTVFQ